MWLSQNSFNQSHDDWHLVVSNQLAIMCSTAMHETVNILCCICRIKLARYESESKCICDSDRYSQVAFSWSHTNMCYIQAYLFPHSLKAVGVKCGFLPYGWVKMIVRKSFAVFVLQVRTWFHKLAICTSFSINFP